MSRLRLLATLILAVSAVALAAPAFAQDGVPVEVIDVSGPLDTVAIDFAVEQIEGAAERGAEVAIVQIDSSATLTPDVDRLVDLVSDPPLPVVVWVGPEPAVARGGAAAVLRVAVIGAAAPGTEIGPVFPLVVGGEGEAPDGVAGDVIASSPARVEGPIDAYVDIVAPSINNLLVELDGRTVSVGGTEVTLTTLDERDGATVAVATTFREPGPWDALLRLAIRPEAAFFFLIVGLAVAIFEFYAIGPGVAAGVSVLSLLVAAPGLAALPLRWWAFGLALVGLWLMTVDFQRGLAGPLTALGSVVLAVGGLFFTDAGPYLRPAWWAIVLIVLFAVFWFLFAMPAVARSRFSTPTVGREHMVGRRGTALTAFTPNGEVDIEGARWPAAAHREANISPGDPVVITAVDGRWLEIDPVDAAAEEQAGGSAGEDGSEPSDD